MGFVFLRKFGCLRLFHDVSHCFSFCLSFQVVGVNLGFFNVVFVCCIFFMLGSCFNLSSTLLCLGILVRFNCLCSIQVDAFWLVYLASNCLGLLGMCFEWCSSF